jgi:hypothetical protein
MSRYDLSPYLIHFTSGATHDEAFRTLQTIVAERRLIGSSTKIKGLHRCICFSEAPLSSLSRGLVNDYYYSRYSPFGVLVSKRWLFEQGGRPVIYQTGGEYSLLPETLRWRHVRYELGRGLEEIDFTWEREWRLRTESLEIDSQVATLVVPDSLWARRLQMEHEDAQDYRVRQYATIFDDQIAEMCRQPFVWSVLTLS